MIERGGARQSVGVQRELYLIAGGAFGCVARVHEEFVQQIDAFVERHSQDDARHTVHEMLRWIALDDKRAKERERERERGGIHRPFPSVISAR